MAASKDGAGNVDALETRAVKIDNTPPTITAAATTQANLFGWYKDPVTVHFTCNDATSGVSACPGDQVLSGEGQNQTSTAGQAVDNAGNISPDSNRVTVNIDRTPPTIVGGAATAPNQAGWYRNNVQVSFTCHDDLSGISLSDLTTCDLVTDVTSEGVNTIPARTVSDAAGNQGSSEPFTIRIDKTPPVVSVTGVTNGAVYTSTPTPGCSTSDALSGVATDATLAVVAGASFTATCSGGTDNAGNSAAPVSVSYSIGTRLPTNTQAMGGDMKVAQGSTLSVGFDFTIPGSHPAETVNFLDTSVTFNATCASGTPNSKTIMINNISDQHYDVSANSSAWYPSGDQNNASTYQGSTMVPSGFCDPGALVRLQQGGTFSTYVTSTDKQDKLNLRWHYKDGTGGGWSGTYSVTPT